jgi:hypothetical protein
LTRRLPQFAPKLLPSENMVAGHARSNDQAARRAFPPIGAMPGGYPPQHQLVSIGANHCSRRTRNADALTRQTLSASTLSRLSIRQDGGIVIDAHVHRMAALILQPQTKPSTFSARPFTRSTFSTVRASRVAERIESRVLN